MGCCREGRPARGDGSSLGNITRCLSASLPVAPAPEGRGHSTRAHRLRSKRVSALCTPLSPHSPAAGVWALFRCLPPRVQAGRFSRGHMKGPWPTLCTRFGLRVFLSVNTKSIQFPTAEIAGLLLNLKYNKFLRSLLFKCLKLEYSRLLLPGKNFKWMACTKSKNFLGIKETDSQTHKQGLPALYLGDPGQEARSQVRLVRVPAPPAQRQRRGQLLPTSRGKLCNRATRGVTALSRAGVGVLRDTSLQEGQASGVGPAPLWVSDRGASSLCGRRPQPSRSSEPEFLRCGLPRES